MVTTGRAAVAPIIAEIVVFDATTAGGATRSATRRRASRGILHLHHVNRRLVVQQRRIIRDHSLDGQQRSSSSSRKSNDSANQSSLDLGSEATSSVHAVIEASHVGAVGRLERSLSTQPEDPGMVLAVSRFQSTDGTPTARLQMDPIAERAPRRLQLAVPHTKPSELPSIKGANQTRYKFF
jgi:hypothetical protein